MAKVGGSSSVFGVLGCGVLCVLIGLCFADLSSKYDRNGGPYVYANDAFGKYVGYGVGWLGMSQGVLGLAAVAVGFGGALERYVALPREPVAVAIIVVLGAINWAGVKAGGLTSTFLSIVKIVPLILVALAGLRFAPQAHLTFEAKEITATAFLAIFMMSGFEYAAVPAGEVRDARKNVPRAVVGSIAGASLLYALLQLAALGALPDLAAREQPLPDVAAIALGAWGGRLLGVTALFSMLGFCAGVALVAPRYFMALADDGHLPEKLREMRPAILASTLFACGLAIVLGYASLVDVSNVVILSGWSCSCLAAFRLGSRKVLALLAFLAAVTLLISARPGFVEWRFTVILLAVGFVVRGLAHRPSLRA